MTEQTAEPASAEFRQWFEDRIKALEIPAREIIASGQDHQPMIFAHSTDGQVAALPLDFKDEDAKDFAAFVHRKLAADDYVYAAIMITEAWAAIEDGSKLMPSERKDRREILMFNALRRNQQLLAIYDIDRKAKTLKLAHITDPFGGPTGGRMILSQPTKH
jgi:hypothetical protein